MKIGKHIGDVVVLRIDLPYSVHRMSSFAAREWRKALWCDRSR
jgi:hypothetical protein